MGEIEQLVAAARARGYSDMEIQATLAKQGLQWSPGTPPAQVADATRTQAGDSNGGLAAAGAAAAGVGAAGVGGVAGAKGLNRAVAKGFANSRLSGAVQQSGGIGALLRELQNYDASGRGAQVTLGDLSRPLGEQGADFVATNNEPARTNLLDIHAERQRGVPQRLLGDVEQLAPGGYSAPSFLSDVSKRSQQDFAAGPHGFQGLRDANPALDPRHNSRLAAFLQSEPLAKAWQDASAVGAVGPLPQPGPTSFETLQNLKERLDGLSDAAWRKGDGDLGKRLGAARDHLVGILRDAVPGYADVSAQYARFAQHQNALELGGEIWKNHDIQLPDLERQLHDMTPEQIKAVRQGVVGGYIKDIENAKTNRNLANEMMTRSATTERKLELIFGSESAFREAVKRFGQEHAMSRLGGYVGGSATARRLAAGGEGAAEIALESTAHPTPSGIMSRLFGKIPQMNRAEQARQLEPYFTTQGSEAIRELLRSLRP